MKRRRLNKAGKNVLIGVITIIIFIPLMCYIHHKYQNEVHIKKQAERYELNITYPIVYQKKLDEQVKQYVEKQKETFLSRVTEQSVSKNKHTLDIQYQYYREQNHYYIHLITDIDKGKPENFRDDKTFHYDSKTKNFLTITDYLKEGEEIQHEFFNLSYYYVMKELESQGITGDDEKIRKLISFSSSSIKNLEHFNVKEQGLEILFPLSQISKVNSNQIIKILIPMKEVKELLKETYQVKIQTNKDKIQEAETIIVKKRNLDKYKNKKLVAFTFDDGPNGQVTNRLLDGVQEYDAKVTFFVLGSRVEQNETVLKRAYQEGHTIGSHTYNHRNLLSLNNYEKMKEIKETNDLIEKTIGVKPTLLRPPYGNINQEVTKLAHMHIIEWNLDTLDWKYKDTLKIANEIVTNVHDGSIILLHDIYESSVEGALLAMKQLEQEGYAFVTIPEMAELKNMELDYTTAYRYFN